MITFDFENAIAVAAHRGDSYNCYENTMDAFQAAYAAGVEMVETDVRLSADRQLVLFHDDRLGRTTGIKAAVNELTLDELRQLNAGDAHHPALIPTLEEFLQWAAPLDLLLNIELKEYNLPGNEGAWEYCADEVVRMVRKYGLEDRVVLNSFDASVLDYIDRKYDHSFRLHGFYPYTGMKNVDRNPDEYLYCACVWGCSKKKEHYDYLIAHGIEPWVGSSITSAQALKLCCEYGARLVTVNYPADAIEKLKGLGKRI